jgi:hypothetical protein
MKNIFISNGSFILFNDRKVMNTLEVSNWGESDIDAQHKKANDLASYLNKKFTNLLNKNIDFLRCTYIHNGYPLTLVVLNKEPECLNTFYPEDTEFKIIIDNTPLDTITIQDTEEKHPPVKMNISFFEKEFSAPITPNKGSV